jgi:hypothetical protein
VVKFFLVNFKVPLLVPSHIFHELFIDNLWAYESEKDMRVATVGYEHYEVKHYPFFELVRVYYIKTVNKGQDYEANHVKKVH